MKPLYFKSRLPSTYKERLSEILFFNNKQREYLENINYSVELFGSPKIIVDGIELRIVIEKLNDLQAIFAMDSAEQNAELLGVILFFRHDIEELIILHIAVVEDCTANGKYAQELIVLRMVKEIKNVSKKLKGVRKMKIFYKGDFNKFTVINI